MRAIYFNEPLIDAHIHDIIQEVYVARVYDAVIEAAKWQVVEVNDDDVVPGDTIGHETGGKFVGSRPTRHLTIVDAGANIGLTTMYFAAHAEKVVAVEPCAAHYVCLCRMVEANGLTNVVTSNLALADKCADVVLHHYGNQTCNSLIATSEELPSSEFVRAVSIDELMLRVCQLNRIDILKLDVEGSESDIIRSAGFRDAAPSIRYIIGEWHENTMLSKNAFRRELIANGYVAGWLSMGDGNANIFVAWREGEREPMYNRKD
jgi:FkbM family methyltransferase